MAGVVGVQHAKGTSSEGERDDYRNGIDET
jgi:hypothetical protein